MSYSHRDRRAHRLIWRVLGVTAVGSVGLGALALYGPTTALEVAGLAGLVALGGATLSLGERAVSDYERDLRSVQVDGGASGLLQAEVRSDVGLERPVGLPTQRSPHARPPARPGNAVVGRLTP
jgi:hypothetical protein